MENKKLKYTLIILGIWWAIAVFLAITQIYLMGLMKVLLIIAIITIPIIISLHLLLYKKLMKKSKITEGIFFLYIFIHFIPLTLQLSGLKEPGFDNIIIALIGSILIYSTKSKREI